MKLLGPIFNVFAIVLMFFLIIVTYKTIKINENEFNKLRLRYTVDYATEAAFEKAIQAEDLELTYEDMKTIQLNPKNIIDTYKTILCLSYDMSLSDENFSALNQNIPFVLLAGKDGYYMATLQTTKSSNNEFNLVWGMKKPYSIKIDTNKYVAVNMYDESYIMAKTDLSNNLELKHGSSFAQALAEDNLTLNKKLIVDSINDTLSKEMNYAITKYDSMFDSTDNEVIYMPTQQTSTGVNRIDKPSLIFMLKNADFVGSKKFSIQSMGGFKTTQKRRVLGFVLSGTKYYCYETQLPEDQLGNIETFFNSIDEAASAGYRPHIEYLRKKIQ